MDPLSISTAVLSITAACISTAKQLSDIRTRYSLAFSTLIAITSETTVVSASLSQIQNALLLSAHGSDPANSAANGFLPSHPASGLLMHLDRNSALAQTLDSALVGCSVVFSALQEEVDKLELGCFRADQTGDRQLDWKTKLKLIWKEDAMKDLLNQIRGQQTSLGFLLQTLSMDSMSEVVRMIKNNSVVLEKMATNTKSLRQAYPSIKSPASIFECSGEDGVSMYSRGASTAGATEFDFDAFITDSKVYRRAFMGGFLKPRRLRDDDSDTGTIRGQEDSDASTVVDSDRNSFREEAIKEVVLVDVLNVKTPDGSQIRMNAKEVSMLLKDSARPKDSFVIKDSLGNELVITQAKYEELLTKYSKVKRYYFEQLAHGNALENQLAKAEGRPLPHPPKPIQVEETSNSNGDQSHNEAAALVETSSSNND